jgi:hypothetical protein
MTLTSGVIQGAGGGENDSAFRTFTKQVIIKSHIIDDVNIQLYHSARFYHPVHEYTESVSAVNSIKING